MSYTLIVAFSFSIVPAATIAVLRYRQIHAEFRPFLYCIWLGCLNECISLLASQAGLGTSVNNNLYVLVESLLISLQFRNWGLFDRKPRLFTIMTTVLVTAWIIENLVMGSLSITRSHFRILYSLFIVLMSVSTINGLILRVRQSLWRHAGFLICMGFILYFTYKILVESFWVYGLNYGAEFRMRVYDILAYVNLAANLVYAIAVLWMPRKLAFTMPY